MDKKVGLKRIDAAYDALLPLGFSRSQIKSGIDSLKKVYGDKIVWRFIEEDSYRVLIETLLEEQKDKGKEVMAPEGATERGESSSREQHGSSIQTYLPLDYDYTPRRQPCAAGDERKSWNDSEGDDHSGGSSHHEGKGCGGWLSDED